MIAGFKELKTKSGKFSRNSYLEQSHFFHEIRDYLLIIFPLTELLNGLHLDIREHV